MSSQLELFSHYEEGQKLKRVALNAMLKMADRLGTKVIAPEVDQSPSNLRLAIREIERHKLTLDDFFTVLAFEPGIILDVLAQVTGHRPLELRPELTESEQLSALLRELGRLGTVGEAILAKAVGSSR